MAVSLFGTRHVRPNLFWAKVPPDQTDDGCWEWAGHISKATGYGLYTFYEFGVQYGEPAHRIAWELTNGPIPEGLHLDHLCRNRACVNPAHLEPVTHAENVRRGMVGQAAEARTHCANGHPYDGGNTYHRKDRPGRECKACQIEATKRWRERNGNPSA